MKKVYISGKIYGLPAVYSQERFERAERKLKASGFDVVNPWRLDKTGCEKFEDYLMIDLAELRNCNSIYMLSNFQESNGAMTEYWFAKGMGLEILYEPSCISCGYYDYNKRTCEKRGYIMLQGMDTCEQHQFSRDENDNEIPTGGTQPSGAAV